MSGVEKHEKSDPENVVIPLDGVGQFIQERSVGQASQNALFIPLDRVDDWIKIEEHKHNRALDVRHHRTKDWLARFSMSGLLASLLVVLAFGIWRNDSQSFVQSVFDKWVTAVAPIVAAAIAFRAGRDSSKAD
ncbi:hypothetical protein [Calycomorphotria hydatis]|uniref:Uncharacterized protein n=1 Tax=Calycomorphotria hydatis TaxID=2528027 RepID=A0A517TDI6_9PLAN|nr:hypothetical protein [Calycomorphotria hydatis]QDT66428.1 hypothetical protein V22_36950 [Calycomorphotria hydatis]